MRVNLIHNIHHKLICNSKIAVGSSGSDFNISYVADLFSWIFFIATWYIR